MCCCPNQQASPLGAGSGPPFRSQLLEFNWGKHEGLQSWFSCDTSLEKKKQAATWSYRCELVSVWVWAARGTAAPLHGCDGDVDLIRAPFSDIHHWWSGGSRCLRLVSLSQNWSLFRQTPSESWRKATGGSCEGPAVDFLCLSSVCAVLGLCEVSEETHEDTGIFTDHIWITKLSLRDFLTSF